MRKTFSEVTKQLNLGYKVLKLVFKASPRWAIFYFAANALSSVVPAVTFYVGKLNIDAIVVAIKSPNQQHITTIVILALVAFAIAGLNSLFASLAGYGFDVMKDLLVEHVLKSVMDKAANLDLAYFENPKFHDQLEKVQREAPYRPINILDIVMEITSSFIGLASLLFILFRLSPWAPLLLVIFSLPRLVYRLRFSKWTYSIADNRSPLNRKVGQINWTMTNERAAKELKAFSLKDYFMAMFEKLNSSFMLENKKLAKKSHGYDFLLDLLAGIVFSGLTLFAAFKIIAGAISLGDFTMFTGTIRQFQNTLQGIFAYISRFYENNLFLTHYFDFMELQPTITNPSHPQKITGEGPLKVELRNVSFAYLNGNPILKNINLTISDAKNFALVGENGAGKTTLVKLLLRLYEPTSGEILINGQNIKDIDLINLRENLGVIFQDFRTYDMSVRENIGFGDIRHINNIGRIRQAARLSGAAEFIEKFPEKYKTILGKNWENGEELSGGQWQKIALARAFFKDARVLIMDEPTSALDPKSEYEVFRNLISHTTHKSLILISHRFSTVRLADEIVVLHHGEIIEQGSHEALMKKSGQYAKLYNLQAKWYK